MIGRNRILTCMALFALLFQTAAAVASASANHSSGLAATRIEEACRRGLALAASTDERLSCLRIRNGELAILVERTYASTLVWLSSRDDLLGALQEDQAKWQKEVGVLGADDAELERIAALHLVRLHAFEVIVAGTQVQARDY